MMRFFWGPGIGLRSLGFFMVSDVFDISRVGVYSKKVGGVKGMLWVFFSGLDANYIRI